jgi:3-methyladenine DNA glycosylase/8-oxoguanine DNA glycosylase
VSSHPEPLRAELTFTPPFDVQAALGNLRAHAIPGLDEVTGTSVRRALLGPSGPVEATVTLAVDAVAVEFCGARPADVAAITARIRGWLDLDQQPAQVADALGRDPVVGPLVAARPGLRVIGSPNGFETAVMAVLGQQVSLARARALGGMLVAQYGEPGPSGLALFPTADALASVPVDALREAMRLTGARARALHELAAACAGGLHLRADADHAAVREGLLAIPGIGPWTADYLAVRVLGDRDAFTASDLVLRRALGRITAREAEAVSQAWRPYRAYALFHLWTATSY